MVGNKTETKKLLYQKPGLSFASSSLQRAPDLQLTCVGKAPGATSWCRAAVHHHLQMYQLRCVRVLGSDWKVRLLFIAIKIFLKNGSRDAIGVVIGSNRS